MIGFYLKKNFCDGWDNMLQMLVVNLIFLLYTVTVCFFVSRVVSRNIALGVSFSILCFAGGMVLVFAYGSCAAAIADFGTPSIRDFFVAIPGAARDGFFFGLLCGVLLAAGFIGIPGYFSINNLVGFSLGIVLFWFEVIAALALQWFLPIRSLMHNTFGKCLKKSFIIFFDNPGFSIFIAFYSLILLILSVFLFFLLPSVTGILLAETNALRLRLYKYDWLEQHPEITSRREQKEVPWDKLIEEDRETLGPRKLKSFIFPWKD